jgi:tetratricopeptide (TPR) repeat protein
VLASVNLGLPRTALGALLQLLFWRAVLALRGVRFIERDEREIAPAVLTRIDVAWTMAIGLGMTDALFGALFNARTLLMALRAGEPFRVARSFTAEAPLRAVAGPRAWPKTEKIIAHSEELAQRTGKTEALAWSRVMTGLSHYLNGRFKVALALCDEALTLYRRAGGVKNEMASTESIALNALAMLGDVRELTRRARENVDDARARGDLYAEVMSTAGLGNLAWLAADDPVRARAKVERVMSRWSKRGFHIEHMFELVALVNVDLYEGDARAAYERLARAAKIAQRSMIFRMQNARIQNMFDHARAALSLAARDAARRPALLTEAASRAKAIARQRAPWGTPLATWIDAGLAAARGDASESARLTDVAARELERHDMLLYAIVARVALAELRGDPDAIVHANEQLRALGVANPARFAAAFAPSAAWHRRDACSELARDA